MTSEDLLKEEFIGLKEDILKNKIRKISSHFLKDADYYLKEIDFILKGDISYVCPIYHKDGIDIDTSKFEILIKNEHHWIKIHWGGILLNDSTGTTVLLFEFDDPTFQEYFRNSKIDDVLK